MYIREVLTNKHDIIRKIRVQAKMNIKNIFISIRSEGELKQLFYTFNMFMQGKKKQEK